MKVVFYCSMNDSNSLSKEETIDTVECLGITDAEWERMSHQEKTNEVFDWMANFLDYGFREE